MKIGKIGNEDLDISFGKAVLIYLVMQLISAVLFLSFYILLGILFVFVGGY